MKRIIIILLLIVAIAPSCQEDFLNMYPLDEITSESYFLTANDLKLYANQFYTTTMVAYVNWEGGIWRVDKNSDNFYFNNPVDKRMAGEWILPATAGNDWNWKVIREANYFMVNYEKCEDSFDTYKHYVGEVLYFRAFLYYELLKKYGALPWIDKPLETNSEELTAPRLPRNEIVDKIIIDLDKAIEYMEPKGSVDKFRVNRDIALIFKSRVCLYEGTWEKYHQGTAFGADGSDGTKYLQAAAAAAEELIGPGVYSIYQTGNPETDYWTLFNQYDYSSNPEIMMWKTFDLDAGVYHRGQNYFNNRGGDLGMTKEFIESYLCTDGKPISVSPLYQGDDNLLTVSENRDLRLAQSLMQPGDILNEYKGVVTYFTKPFLDKGTRFRNTTGYQMYKGSEPGWKNITDSRNIAVVSAILFRYAEVLLNYAEAKAELGTINQADLDISINKLRDRVAMPHLSLGSIETDPKWEYPVLSPIINEIRRERRIELMGEGHRLDDIMRWRAHHLIVGNTGLGAIFHQDEFPNLEIGKTIFVNSEGYIEVFQKSHPSGLQFNPDRDYLYPIPSNELVLNPNLGQNPGWEE